MYMIILSQYVHLYMYMYLLHIAYKILYDFVLYFAFRWVVKLKDNKLKWIECVSLLARQVQVDSRFQQHPIL